MTTLSAPTRARREIVDERRADPHAPPRRVPFRLSDDLTIDIAAAIRRGKPRISDDELEAALVGFEQISRDAAQRAAQALEVEATVVGPKASLLHRLGRVDDAIDALAEASTDGRAAAVERLSSVAGGLGEVLRPHGLADSWRVDAVSNPNQMREVIAAARRATGVDGGRLAAARREQRATETRRVVSDASALWRETFSEADEDAPGNFTELAQRAIAESSQGDSQ